VLDSSLLQAPVVWLLLAPGALLQLLAAAAGPGHLQQQRQWCEVYLTHMHKLKPTHHQRHWQAAAASRECSY